VPHVLSRLVDRDTTDIKAYDIRTNSSSETIKYVLKDLRDKYFEYFILMCSSKNADFVLTQVSCPYITFVSCDKVKYLPFYLNQRFGHHAFIEDKSAWEHFVNHGRFFKYIDASYILVDKGIERINRWKK